MRIFLTGASGFVGARLLERLLLDGHHVVALDRSGRLRDHLDDGVGGHGAARRTAALEIVRGELAEPPPWRAALHGADVVVHLAALTGRASTMRHLRENARATEILLECAQSAGVPRFLFISSIAAKFPNHAHYAYARAKAIAEGAVARSASRYTILRPTLVMGPGSPVFAALRTLARLPLTPVFGNGRTPTQPVHVDDVADAIARVLATDRFAGETLEVGGPVTLPIAALLSAIRAADGGGPPRFVRVPFALVVPPLRVAEGVGLTPWLPLNEGQLSAFRYASTILPNDLHDAQRATLRGLDDMLRTPRAAHATAAEDALATECARLTAYLIDQAPTEYVVGKYREAHGAIGALGEGTRFDWLLLHLARRNAWLARMADVHARFFRPRGLLRRKLVLLLAILETSGASGALLDRAPRGGLARVVAALCLRGIASGIALACAIVVLLPAQLALERKTAHR